jgi:hypothetical protein
MRVVNTSTQCEVEPGTMLHMISGPSAGQAWRLEKVATRHDGDHQLHVSRSLPKLGRVHREFHPRLFGCVVVIDVKFYADVQKLKHACAFLLTQFTLLFIGGVIAWLIADYMSHGGA